MDSQPGQEPQDATRLVEARQAAYLDRVVPGHRIVRVRWSGGATQVIEAGHGQPLLLLHGGLGEAFQWAPLMPALAERYRVLAVDRPGHGLADAFDYRGTNMLDIASRFANEILDALNLPSAAVLGNSMGGLWATGFALSHPERVTRLLLIGASAGIQRAVPWSLRLGSIALFSGALKSGLTSATRDSLRTFWGERIVVHPERLGDDFLDLCVASQLRNYPSWISLLQSAIDLGGLKANLLLAERWKHLQPPTTLIWGEQDRWVPPAAGERITAAHPHIRMIRVPNVGHAPWFDDAPAIARAVEAALIQHV
jgi:2-hydroxy-6-oxonona-2,4-dienedioate hydrolase